MPDEQFDILVSDWRKTGMGQRLNLLEEHIRRMSQGEERRYILALFLSLRRDIEEDA